MTLKKLIKNDEFVDFRFKNKFNDELFCTNGDEVHPSEIYNYKLDYFIGLSSIIDLLDEEVEIVNERV
jgi:hypothetical protein